MGATFIQMDETYLQVVRSDKAAGSDHYMVVRAGGAPGRRVVLFNYLPSRTGEALKGLLDRPERPVPRKTADRWPGAIRYARGSAWALALRLSATLPHLLPQGGEGHGAPFGTKSRSRRAQGHIWANLRGRAGDQGAARERERSSERRCPWSGCSRSASRNLHRSWPRSKNG